jgi:hypothetical protein
LRVGQKAAHFAKRPEEEFVDLQLAVTEFGSNTGQKGLDLVFGQVMTRAKILPERWSLMSRNRRASTWVRSGYRMTVRRLLSIGFIG